MGNYVVQPGDTLTSIADKFQLTSWKRISDHPNNAQFRRKRPNPNLIHPGDEVFVPDVEPDATSAATDQSHIYTYKRPKQVLRLVIEDMDGKRLANTPYKLVIDGALYSGTTDGQALIEKDIPLSASQGLLKISDYKWNLAIGHLNPLDENTPDGGISGAQGRLLNLGYPVGLVDGICGPKTKAALRYFQADESLQETGELDAATRSKLLQVHGV